MQTELIDKICIIHYYSENVRCFNRINVSITSIWFLFSFIWNDTATARAFVGVFEERAPLSDNLLMKTTTKNICQLTFFYVTKARCWWAKINIWL